VEPDLDANEIGTLRSVGPRPQRKRSREALVVRRPLFTKWRGWWLLAAFVLLVGCGMRPLRHDGPVIPLGNGELEGRAFKAYGFRRGSMGCVGWETNASRDVLCSGLLRTDEAVADDAFAKKIHEVLGRVGLGVQRIDLVTQVGTVSPGVVRGERENYFVTTIPSQPIDEVILYGAEGRVLRRDACRDVVGYPALEACLPRGT
jgi:hypothetical protein